VLAVSLLAAPGAAEARPAGKVYRVGILTAGSVTANPGVLDAFRQGLRELGYVEGQNIVIEYRSAEGRFDRRSDLAAELVRLKVDVIVSAPTPAALATKNATGAVPIAGVNLTEPVGLGLIASLARPGGNVTGLSVLGPDLVGKCLEQLTQAVPGSDHRRAPPELLSTAHHASFAASVWYVSHPRQFCSRRE